METSRWWTGDMLAQWDSALLLVSMPMRNRYDTDWLADLHYRQSFKPIYFKFGSLFLMPVRSVTLILVWSSRPTDLSLP